VERNDSDLRYSVTLLTVTYQNEITARYCFPYCLPICHSNNYIDLTTTPQPMSKSAALAGGREAGKRNLGTIAISQGNDHYPGNHSSTTWYIES